MDLNPGLLPDRGPALVAGGAAGACPRLPDPLAFTPGWEQWLALLPCPFMVCPGARHACPPHQPVLCPQALRGSCHSPTGPTLTPSGLCPGRTGLACLAPQALCRLPGAPSSPRPAPAAGAGLVSFTWSEAGGGGGGRSRAVVEPGSAHPSGPGGPLLPPWGPCLGHTPVLLLRTARGHSSPWPSDAQCPCWAPPGPGQDCGRGRDRHAVSNGPPERGF